MNAIMENSLRQTVGPLVSPVMPADIAEALNKPGGIPKIQTPVVATLNQRIGSLAKKLLGLERDIMLLRGEDRSKWEDTSTDMDALLHEAEHSAGVLDTKLNGEARAEERARDAADWAETESSLRTFGLSAK
jgi:hypothetical protein